MQLNKNKLMVALAVLFASNAFALSDPIRYEAQDKRNAVAYFDKRNVIKINASEGYITTLSFPDQETITDLIIGSEKLWSVIPDTNRRKLFIKPTGINLSVGDETEVQNEYVEPNELDWLTNLVVVTNKRSYQFELNFITDPALVNFNIDISLGSPPAPKPVLTDKQKKQYAVTAKKNAEVREKQAIETAKKNAVNKTSIPANWNYQLNYSSHAAKDLAPKFIYDDGKFTYIGINKNKTLPAIFKLSNGEEGLVGSNVKNSAEGTVLVVHGLYPKLVLRQGQLTIEITRKAK